MNLGSFSENSFGEYYAWGEKLTKDSYTYSNYAYSEDGTTEDDALMTKYVTSDAMGDYREYEDDLSVLQSDDDAATFNLGSSWRTPTIDEWKELVDECTWTSETVDGQEGWRATGPNGNSIFLPIGSNTYGSSTYYMSSSLTTTALVDDVSEILDHEVGARIPYFDYLNENKEYVTSMASAYRWSPFVVRAVRE